MQLVFGNLLFCRPNVPFLGDGRDKATRPSSDKCLSQGVEVRVFSEYFNRTRLLIFTSENVQVLLVQSHALNC